MPAFSGCNFAILYAQKAFQFASCLVKSSFKHHSSVSLFDFLSHSELFLLLDSQRTFFFFYWLNLAQQKLFLFTRMSHSSNRSHFAWAEWPLVSSRLFQGPRNNLLAEGQAGQWLKSTCSIARDGDACLQFWSWRQEDRVWGKPDLDSKILSQRTGEKSRNKQTNPTLFS